MRKRTVVVTHKACESFGVTQKGDDAPLEIELEGLTIRFEDPNNFIRVPEFGLIRLGEVDGSE